MKAQPDSVRFEKGQTKNYSLSRYSALMNPFGSIRLWNHEPICSRKEEKKLNTRGISNGKG